MAHVWSGLALMTLLMACSSAPVPPRATPQTVPRTVERCDTTATGSKICYTDIVPSTSNDDHVPRR